MLHIAADYAATGLNAKEATVGAKGGRVIEEPGLV